MKKNKTEGNFEYRSVQGVTYKVTGTLNPDQACGRCSGGWPQRLVQIRTDCAEHRRICVNCLMTGQQVRSTRCQTCPEPTLRNEQRRRLEINYDSASKAECTLCDTAEPVSWSEQDITTHEMYNLHTMKCPNRSCMEQVGAKHMKVHREMCLHEQQACVYRSNGCPKMIPRKLLADHKSSCLFQLCSVAGIETTEGVRMSLGLMVRILSNLSTNTQSSEDARLLPLLYQIFGQQMAPFLKKLKGKTDTSAVTNPQVINDLLDAMVKVCEVSSGRVNVAQQQKFSAELSKHWREFCHFLKDVAGISAATSDESQTLSSYCYRSGYDPEKHRRELPDRFIEEATRMGDRMSQRSSDLNETFFTGEEAIRARSTSCKVS